MVQRVRIRYAKRGPLRFTSHRDFARAFERAIRRAGVPIAFSQGFTPHPRISYASAAPTGVASEAEYLEIGLRERVEPEALRGALDAALSPGLDVLAATDADGAARLADQLEASHWRIELVGISPDDLAAAADKFLAAGEVMVERLTKQGRRRFDARGPVIQLKALPDAPSDPTPTSGGGGECAILDLAVRHVTPSVRPDDVLAGLRSVANLEPPEPPRVTRLAQGKLTEQGEIVDPLIADHNGTINERLFD